MIPEVLVIWLQSKPDADDILLPKLLFVKQRNRPMEEHCPKKLLDQVRDAIRLKHDSYRTVQGLLGHKACPE